MHKGLQALGRLPTGKKNGLELEFERDVIKPQMAAGEIVWARFEGMKFRLADNTFYTPDWPTMRADGLIEIFEVKGGYWEDDARVKIKVAASMYPFQFIGVMRIPKKHGGGWDYERF
jgi:hypothetical protein